MTSQRDKADAARRLKLKTACDIARRDAMTSGREVGVVEVMQREARRRRYQLRDIMAAVTNIDRLRGCGRIRTSPIVTLRLGSRGAGFGGVGYCESIWSCPTCSALIRAKRAEEIQEATGRHIAGGGGGMFITMTLPHGKRDALRGTLSQVTKGWGHIMNKKQGREWRDRLGIIGYIRAVEVTDGPSGWHPHLHLLVLTEKPVSADLRAAFHAWLTDQWVKYCADRDWKRTDGKHAIDIQDVTSPGALGAYVAKVQDGSGADRVLGSELARADLKSGRRKGRTPFELLAAIEAMWLDPSVNGSSKQVAHLTRRWQEFEAETKGLSALRWSPKLRDRLGVKDVTDKQIIEEISLGDDVQVVAEIDAVGWQVLGRMRLRSRILDVAETQGGRAAETFIRDAIAAYLEDWAAGVESCFEDPPPDH